ncbi:MAG: hypothetical protein LBL00_07725 [Endomicrobium sp.]|nr:hypothetical protein [Endomicrobium sp.]
MKKNFVFTFVLVFCLAFVLISCGGSGSNSSGNKKPYTVVDGKILAFDVRESFPAVDIAGTPYGYIYNDRDNEFIFSNILKCELISLVIYPEDFMENDVESLEDMSDTVWSATNGYFESTGENTATGSKVIFVPTANAGTIKIEFNGMSFSSKFSVENVYNVQ